jgi:hypothetical protein
MCSPKPAGRPASRVGSILLWYSKPPAIFGFQFVFGSQDLFLALAIFYVLQHEVEAENRHARWCLTRVCAVSD